MPLNPPTKACAFSALLMGPIESKKNFFFFRQFGHKNTCMPVCRLVVILGNIRKMLTTDEHYLHIY